MPKRVNSNQATDNNHASVERESKMTHICTHVIMLRNLNK